MSVIDLKEYTTRAAELESAIYTQKKLMAEHKMKLREHRPTAPIEHFLNKPVQPNKDDYTIQHESHPVLSALAVIAILFAIFVVFSAFVFEDFDVGAFVWFAVGVWGIYYLINRRLKKKADNQLQIQKDEEYEEALLRYNSLKEKYNADAKAAHAQHLEKMEEFNLLNKNYTAEADGIVKKHNHILEELESALQEHYDQNIVFSKYRNMVAITTINEYLMSGRCYELEGPDGAYNLYEMELRQNIIIGQLSSIVNSLEQIKNNQFSLYQELVKANKTVNDILCVAEGVKENTRMTAYFAGVTALIEASPKTYISHTF